MVSSPSGSAPVWWGRSVAAPLGAVALAAAVWTGCSGHQIDQTAWKAQLAARGITPENWYRFQALAMRSCRDDMSGTTVAAALDAGIPLAIQRIDVSNACPDRLDDLNVAIADFTSSRAAVDLACQIPADQRSQEQRDLAAAMRC